MADQQLAYDLVTGNLIYNPDTGNLAWDCEEPVPCPLPICGYFGNRETVEVDVENGSATVTLSDSGEVWPAWMAYADINIDGVEYRVSTRVSDTQITLSTNYTGSTDTNIEAVPDRDAQPDVLASLDTSCSETKCEHEQDTSWNDTDPGWSETSTYCDWEWWFDDMPNSVFHTQARYVKASDTWNYFYSYQIFGGTPYSAYYELIDGGAPTCVNGKLTKTVVLDGTADGTVDCTGCKMEQVFGS